MKNKEFYKETMEQIRMSEDVFRRVRNAEALVGKHRRVLKYIAVVASFVVALLVSGNGIVYAMTGETLVDKLYAVYEDVMGSTNIVDSYLDEDGYRNYVIEDGATYGVKVEGHPMHTSIIVYATETGHGIWKFEGTLKEENGKIMLYLFTIPIDITEDFADGVATGTEERNYGGTCFEYIVQGNLEEYTVKVNMILPEEK